MSWFHSDPEPEEQVSQPVRLASAEFISGLVELAELYERREKMYRGSIVKLASDLAAKTYFNSGDIERATNEIASNVHRANSEQANASEVRDIIRSYEYHGARPPYMPAPSEPPKQDSGGS